MIHAHLSGEDLQGGSVEVLNLSAPDGRSLRYGENPHQKGQFFGDLDGLLKPLHGKALSYNNLLDVDAAVQLMSEFQDDAPTFAILKHNNACGCATRETLEQAYIDALAGDPTSAFGGVLISNRPIDVATAHRIHELFCEVVIAPQFEAEAFAVLSQKKNRILLEQQPGDLPKSTGAFRTQRLLGPRTRQRHGGGGPLDMCHRSATAGMRRGSAVCAQIGQAHEVEHRGVRQGWTTACKWHRPNEPSGRIEPSRGKGQSVWI
jgi:AICAR transformylase/IMP cyclohydrolase PurH